MTKNDRFKWEPICRIMDKKINLEELRELARIDNIQFVELMSKRQLCVRLSQRISEIATFQKEHHDKCANKDSFYGGDEVKEIAPEFFFTYRHNGQTYCEDIRKLYKWITTNGPYHIDRTRFSTELTRLITQAYTKLYFTTVHMNDIVTEKEQEISLDSKLSSAVGDFVSKLRHAPSSGFISAGEVQFNMFLEGLINENVINRNELLIIKQKMSIQEKKLKVIDILLPKIGREDYLTFTSEVWNHTFKDGTIFDLSNKTENLLKQIRISLSLTDYTINFVNCDKNTFDNMLNVLVQRNIISDVDIEDIKFEKSTLREAEKWELDYVKRQKTSLSTAEFDEFYPINFRGVNSYDNKIHYNDDIEYNEYNFIAKKLFLVNKLVKKTSPPPVLLLNMLSPEQKADKIKIVEENIQKLINIWMNVIPVVRVWNLPQQTEPTTEVTTEITETTSDADT